MKFTHNTPILLLLLIFFISNCGNQDKESPEIKRDLSIPSKIFEPLDAIAFLNKTNEKNIVILDVRPDYLVKKGIIKNALTIDVLGGDFNAQVRNLDKTKTYLIYSRTGRRGVTACRRMADMNFYKLYNLDGGYEAWQRVVLKQINK